MKIRFNSDEFQVFHEMLKPHEDLLRQFHRAVIIEEGLPSGVGKAIADPVMRELRDAILAAFTRVFTTGTSGYIGSYRYGCRLSVDYEDGVTQELPLVFTCKNFDLDNIVVEFYHQRRGEYWVTSRGGDWFGVGVMDFLTSYCGRKDGSSKAFHSVKFETFHVSKGFYLSKTHKDHFFVAE